MRNSKQKFRLSGAVSISGVGIAFVGAAAQVARAQLVITPTFDSTITSDPNATAIENVINNAVAVYETRFNDPVSINIDFQEGGGVGESESYYGNVPNSQFMGQLIADQTTANDAIALAHLPASGNNPVTNDANIYVKSTNLAALGYTGVTGMLPGGFDGIITLNTQRTTPGSSGTTGQFSLMSVAEHEIDEVLGLGSALNIPSAADPLPEDLFRYDSMGNRSFTTSGDDANFSLDGTTDLARFNQDPAGDYGDWWSNNGFGNSGTNPPPQVQDAFAYPGTSPTLGVEFTALDVIGFDLVDDAYVWSPTSGASWNAGVNWTPAGVPNAPGAHVSFLTSGGGGTVALDASQTVGQILFDSTIGYTISAGSGGTLTIDDTTDPVVNPAIYVNNGSHVISAPIVLANGVNVNFQSGTGLTISNTITGTGPITVNGMGTLNIATTAVLPAASALSINTGAMVVLAASATPSMPVVQTVASLSFDSNPGSQLDITNNELIITGTPPAAILADIIGLHLTSSLADSTHSLGYMASGSGTEVRYTILGDCNLDGSVNFSDLLTLAANYGSTTATWDMGDFNYDSTVNFSDLLTLAANYGESLSPSEASEVSPSFAADWNLALSETAASVPEPASGALIALGAGVLLRRCRRGL